MAIPEARQTTNERGQLLTEIYIPTPNETAGLFDWDGTVMDNATPQKAAWHILAERHEIPVTEEQLDSFIGKKTRSCIRILFGQHLPSETVEALYFERLAIYENILAMDPKEIPGCKKVLTAMGATGCKLAIVTSGSLETRNLQIPLLIDRPEKTFHHITGVEHVEKHKPDPEPYLYTMRRLGIAAEMCIAFEDSREGVASAAEAGIGIVFGISSRYMSAEELHAEGAGLTIPDYTGVRITQQ